MEANASQETFRAPLLRKLRGVIERDDTHVVIIADDGSNRYVQFAEGRGEVRAEAVGNRYLANGFKLNENQERLLTELGWHPPVVDSAGNWWMSLAPEPHLSERAAELALNTLGEVYGISTGRVLLDP